MVEVTSHDRENIQFSMRHRCNVAKINLERYISSFDQVELIILEIKVQKKF